MSMTLPDAGRVTLAAAMQALDWTLAVGRGDPEWGEAPEIIVGTETALEDPYAMVRPSQCVFVAPDVNGAIELADSSKWSVSAEPTRYVYCAFVLGFADGPGETVRELAIYIGATFVEGTPPGATYLPWASVATPGDLLCLKRVAPIERAGVRHTFGEVLTF